MPGFVICGTGDSQVSSVAEARRVHRWVFQVLSFGTTGRGFQENELLYLKTASRPNFKFEDPTLHHDQEQIYYAGKQTWEPISLTWYDIENDPNISQSIWEWFNNVVDFERACVNPPSQYKGDGVLSMVSGCAAGSNGSGFAGGARITETWKLCNAWPKESNWGTLDYSSSEIATIEVVLRYDRALKTL